MTQSTTLTISLALIMYLIDVGFSCKGLYLIFPDGKDWPVFPFDVCYEGMSDQLIRIDSIDVISN